MELDRDRNLLLITNNQKECRYQNYVYERDLTLY